MAYDSTTSPHFLAPVRAWIETSEEVLVMIRYSHAAGARDFEFFDSFASLQNRLLSLPSRTCVIAFLSQQLPLRGRVDERFINNAMELLPEGKEWLTVALELTVAGSRSWFHSGDGITQASLREELEDCAGTLMAVGPHPSWLQDSETVVSAVVPQPDGTVVTGAY